MSIDRNAVTLDPRVFAPTLEPRADDALPPQHDDAPHIDGYRMVSRLGEGGMGAVWRAVQLSTRREVALKLLRPIVIGSRKARARFEREVELAAKLEHPNLARVYDSGRHAGIDYYAMQLIDGMHLDTYVTTRRCSRRQIIELMRNVCRAIQHAHQRGVIHRDLKPSNILVGGDATPYVVDFGLAKTLFEDDSAGPISIDGDVAGTPAYMSPEQAAGKIAQIDTRSDVYSLGVILYQLLTGTTPHDSSGTSWQVMKRIQDEDVRRPRSVSRTIDREMEALLLKALARDPERRYASAGELAADLDNYLSGEPLTAKKPTTRYFLVKKLRKHRLPLGIVGGVIAIVCLAATAWASYRYTEAARIELITDPPGAYAWINGTKHKCQTPCFVDLERGDHEIVIEHPNGLHQRAVRRIRVAWGQALGDAREPVTMRLNSQACTFSTNPPGALVTVTDDRTGAVHRGTTPCVMTLPVGHYTMSFSKSGYADESDWVSLNILGDSMPRIIERELKRISND